MARELLPPRRETESIRMVRSSNGYRAKEYIVSIGRYQDGRVAEIFLQCDHAEFGEQALVSEWCVSASIALQCGTPLSLLRDAVQRDEEGCPATMIGEMLDLICDLPQVT